MRMRDPTIFGQELRAWIKARNFTEQEFAHEFSKKNGNVPISQSWLSRILAGEFRRPTSTIQRLASYANIRLFETEKNDPDGAAIIAEAVKRVWNGSESQAHLIAKLIRAAEGATIIGKK